MIAGVGPSRDSSAAAVGDARTDARVGPNAVTRLAEALRTFTDEATTRAVFARAGALELLRSPPESMVDQQAVGRLYGALHAMLELSDAQTVARDAGRRTARYLLAHRIPAVARLVIRLLPQRIASRVLLTAVSKHAWTFAGSGRVDVQHGWPSVVTIHGNPLAMPGCTWHVAVFDTLFTALVSSRITVTHTHCEHAGADHCRFVITPRSATPVDPVPAGPQAPPRSGGDLRSEPVSATDGLRPIR